MIKNLKVNTKKVAAITGLTFMLALLPGCGKENHQEMQIELSNGVRDSETKLPTRINVSLSNKSKKRTTTLIDLLDEVKDSTSFDEMMNENDVRNVDLIDKYIDLSERLHKMEFDRSDMSDDIFLLNVTDLKILMSYYDNKRDFSSDELCYIEKKLTKQERLVNEYIYNSYDVVSAVVMSGLKSKILDVKGVEINRDHYNDIRIQNAEYSNYNDPSIGMLNIEQYKADRNSDLGKLLESVFQMQERGINPSSETIPYEYNPDRNKLIKDSINNLKTALNYYYEDGIFHRLVRKKHV